MELFQKRIGPVFLKEDSDAESFIAKMNALAIKSEGQIKKEIETETKLATYGLFGEKNIAFELKNSDIDMYILHDLYLEHNNMQAQIDYLIITRKRIYVIECKNLIGNIEIDNSGNFIRTYELFGKKIKEGLYSPITQNERHRLVIKGLRGQGKNLLTKFLFEKNFDKNYKSVVVLANPKTYLNAKFAKKEIKDQVIRADQLVAYIKEKDKEVSEFTYSGEEMRKLATFFLEKNISERSDYSRKYEEMLQAVAVSKAEENKTVMAETVNVEIINSDNCEDNKLEIKNSLKCPRCGAELVLRMASKGVNAGKQFYGCKSFPKCRYIQDKE